MVNSSSLLRTFAILETLLKEKTFIFGPFQFTPARGILLEEGKPIRLGSRAMEVLTALLEGGGDLVRHEDMVQRVWPNTFVSESNVRVHIRAIRRALREESDGIRYVLNIPGRGYRFVVPTCVSFTETAVSSPSAESPSRPIRSLRISKPRLPEWYVVLFKGRKIIRVAKVRRKRLELQGKRRHSLFA